MYILIDIRILLVFLYSLDCFASVFVPFMYPRHSLKLTVLNSVLVWLVVIISNVLGIPQILDCYILSNDGLVCIKHGMQYYVQGIPIDLHISTSIQLLKASF